MPRKVYDTPEEELKYRLWQFVRQRSPYGGTESKARLIIFRVLARSLGLDWLEGFDDDLNPREIQGVKPLNPPREPVKEISSGLNVLEELERREE